MSIRSLVVGAAALMVSLAALAGGAVNVSPSGLAIHGFDPVAYFTDSAPTQGDASITAEHMGATFAFASAANRDTFLADPGKYAPQYGGFCAYAASKNAKADIDPIAWTIHNGKLYLNFNQQVQRIWSGDKDANIEKADAFWPALSGQ